MSEEQNNIMKEIAHKIAIDPTPKMLLSLLITWVICSTPSMLGCVIYFWVLPAAGIGGTFAIIMIMMGISIIQLVLAVIAAIITLFVVGERIK